MKNVHHRIKIVHANPLRVALALYVRGTRVALSLEAETDVVRNRFDLRMRIAFADNKKISGSITELTQVQFENILPFDVLNAVND